MTDRSKLNEAMDRFTLAIDRAYRWRITNCGSYIADNENSYDKAALALIKEALVENEGLKYKSARKFGMNSALHSPTRRNHEHYERPDYLAEGQVTELAGGDAPNIV